MTVKVWLAIALALVSSALAEDRTIGSVVRIDHASRHITIRTDAGREMQVVFDDQTVFQRVAPGETNLKNASGIEVSEITAGDRVLARGGASVNGQSIAARSVIVMAKADIERKQAVDRAEWDRRGIGGIVKSVNAEAKEITIAAPGLGRSSPVVIEVRDKTILRRYAPDSVKFGDARPSRFEDIQVGDQVRALGNKSEDGARYVAEELVSGSFVNIAATVDAIDAAGRLVAVTDLTARKKISVRLTPDSTIRKLAPFAARLLAGSSAGPLARGRPSEGLNPRSADGGGPASAAPQNPRNLQALLENMPAIALADLKPGDAVIIASTRGKDPSLLTAITILAGVEPLLESGNDRSSELGAWNLNLNLNMSLP